MKNIQENKAKMPKVKGWCDDCGAEYTTSANNARRTHRCPECQSHWRYGYDDRLPLARRKTCGDSSAFYTLIYDPDDGFSRGAQLTRHEITELLRMTYREGWTVRRYLAEGTQFTRGNQLYVVRNGELVRAEAVVTLRHNLEVV